MALTDCRTILNFETTAKMSPSDGYLSPEFYFLFAGLVSSAYYGLC